MNFVPPKAPQQREAAIGLRGLLTEWRLEDEEANDQSKKAEAEDEDEDENEDEKLQ